MATVYLYNDQGYYIGEGSSIPHPFEVGEDALPNNSTWLEVLPEKEGYMIRHEVETEELPERWSYEKILTEIEQKISGELSLSDGEYVEDGELISVEAPSVLHTWNTETHAWDLDEEKVFKARYVLYSKVSELRDTVLDTGLEFEAGKVLKSRDKDLTRSLVAYTQFKDGLIPLKEDGTPTVDIYWTFSNGVNEKLTGLDRITEIFNFCSKLVLLTCSVDGAVKLMIQAITDYEELLAFDTNTVWTETFSTMKEMFLPSPTSTTTEETTTETAV